MVSPVVMNRHRATFDMATASRKRYDFWITNSFGSTYRYVSARWRIQEWNQRGSWMGDAWCRYSAVVGWVRGRTERLLPWAESRIPASHDYGWISPGYRLKVPVCRVYRWQCEESERFHQKKRDVRITDPYSRTGKDVFMNIITSAWEYDRRFLPTDGGSVRWLVTDVHSFRKSITRWEFRPIAPAYHDKTVHWISSDAMTIRSVHGKEKTTIPFRVPADSADLLMSLRKRLEDTVTISGLLCWKPCDKAIV